MEQAGKALAEHVHTDEDREELQNEQRADADRRVFDDIQHGRQRQLVEAGRKAQVCGGGREDEHQNGTRAQPHRAALALLRVLRRVAQRDLLRLLGGFRGLTRALGLLAGHALVILRRSGFRGFFLRFALGFPFGAARLFRSDLFRRLFAARSGFGFARGDALGAGIVIVVLLRLLRGRGAGRTGLGRGARRLRRGGGLHLRRFGRLGRGGRFGLRRGLDLRRRTRRGLGLRGRAALHLGDDRIQIEIAAVRHVTEHRPDVVQIHHIVFSVHIVSVPLHYSACVRRRTASNSSTAAALDALSEFTRPRIGMLTI